MHWFRDICMILSLLFSLRLIKNPRVIKYMRYFYWYSIVGAAMTFLTLISNTQGIPLKELVMGIRNYSILFHFTFLSFFIYSVLPRKEDVKFLFPLFFTFLSITLFFLVFYSSKKMNSASFSAANLGLIIFCVIYFYRLFNEVPKTTLLKQPAFWVISGIFLCMSISIPVISLDSYLKNENYVNLQYREIFSGIIYFAYGSFHLFLIKAYLCSIGETV